MATERLQKRIENLLDEAETAVSELNWTVVLDRAQAVLGLDPDNADGLALKAAAQRELGVSSGITVSISSPRASPPTTTAITTPSAHPTSFANGRYRVKRFLGEGSKKRVYVAYDGSLDREVALAVIKSEGLDGESKARLTREARAMERLGDHSNILAILDRGEENGQPYLALPLMAGGDLGQLLDSVTERRLSMQLTISIGKEVCRGLEFAHSKGVMHRDLKPSNIWLTSEGVAKIGDFGLAMILDSSRLTVEGTVVGTVSYLPPEQVTGGEITPKADLYSLGAMLYEMVTGRPPFLGDDSVAIIGQHINTPPVAPAWHNKTCPRLLDALIMRLLAKNPSERPDSASDVLSALDAIDLAASTKQPPVGVIEGRDLDSLAGGVFVGRQQEMGVLKAALEDALSGRGKLVTLSGEPGSGKTRIALELATYAGLRQAQVLRGRCYEEEGTPPYWPWVQVIRSYIRDADPEQLRWEMGVGAADIAEVVHDVRERLPEITAPPKLEPSQARFRLFDSITGFLKSASLRKPIVLVLDDLHWADLASLQLLEFAAKELSNARILIIGTYRDVEISRQHPLSKSLAELNRESSFQQVMLRGLNHEDVGRFIELASGISPPTGMVEEVHRQTEGNPLFVTEVVRLLAQEGELTQETLGQTDSWSVRIPEGVREVIRKRLGRLSEQCNEILTIASVIGREFTVAQLSPIIENPRPAEGRTGQAITKAMLLNAVDEALSARLIEEMTGVGRYQFTHALIKDTLAGELSTSRKPQLHARIAEGLEWLYGTNVTHVAELAHHFAEAQTLLGTEKMVRYSLLAGERSLAAYANEEALGHFQSAISAKEIQHPDAEMAAALFGLGRAQAATLGRQQLDVAFATMGRAFDIYAGTNDVAGAVGVAEYPIQIIPGQLGGRELVDRALQLISRDSQEAGRLLARYVLFKGMGEGDYEGASEASNTAFAIAQRTGDVALEMRTLANFSMVDFWHLRMQGTAAKGLRVIELAGRSENQLSEVSARFWVGVALLAIGDSKEAQPHAEAMLATAERLRDRYWLTTALWLNELTCIFKGDWQAAKDFSQRGLMVSPPDVRLLGSRMLLEYQTGNVFEGDGYLDPLVETLRVVMPGPTYDHASAALLIPAVARITGAVDRIYIAEDAAATVLAAESATPMVTLIARWGLALMAVARGDVELAQAQYSALKSGAGTQAIGLNGDRILGLVAQTIGDLEMATKHFEDALAFCRKASYRPELAWTCCDYADMLLERNGDGDGPKATTLLDESLAISTELGMRPLMERVLSRREILGA